MTDPVERLVNLAMFIAHAKSPVTAERIHAEVAGYPAGQAEQSFLRMFERDKDHLRAAGLAIAVEDAGGCEGYVLDAAGTFAGELDLSPLDAVLIRVAGDAKLADPSFPYRTDLALALAKVAAAAGGQDGAVSLESVNTSALTADERPAHQADAVAGLTEALSAGKRAGFRYTNVSGRTAHRDVEPYGLFARDGRWYLVARDRDADAVRVFAVARIDDLEIDTTRLKSRDFEVPGDFDVKDWMLLPFQYGADRTEALLRVTGPAAARGAGLTGGQGALEEQSDGSLLWRVRYSDADGLAGWTIANGPGIEILEPPALRAARADGLQRVVEAHG